MFFLSVKDTFRWLVGGAIRGILASFCEFIYTIISWVWELLLDVAGIRLLNSSTCSISGITTKIECISQGGTWTDSPITLIYKRFTLLLGIIMTFYIIFQFIKYLMTPEEIEDKEKGIEKLGFKLLTVVVLLAITPTLFDKAYDVQNIILKNQILPKIVLGKTGMNNATFGRDFSASLLSNFYYVEGYEQPDIDDEDAPDSSNQCFGLACNLIVSRTLGMFRSTGTLTDLDYGLNAHGDIGGSDTYYIHFDGLFALAVGAFICYMLLMYTIDVGARVVQLTFLQIIAPIPIITYLSPKKDGTFQKWAKQCWVTYLDLFIRLTILFFVTLLIEAISDAYHANTLFPNLDESSSLPFFIYLVLILGLMMFCKRAPKMVQELFPSMGVASGTFGLKAGERVPEGARRVAGAAIGAGAGALIGMGTGIAQGLRANKQGKGKGVGGAIQGAFGGLFGGATRGLYNGSKKGNMFKNIGTGIKNQTAANKNFGNRLESGYKFHHQVGDTLANVTGIPNRKDKLEKEKTRTQSKKNIMDGGVELNNKRKEEAEKKVREGKGRFSGELAAAEAKVTAFKDDPNVRKRYDEAAKEKKRQEFKTSAERQTYVDAARNANSNKFDSDESIRQKYAEKERKKEPNKFDSDESIKKAYMDKEKAKNPNKYDSDQATQDEYMKKAEEQVPNEWKDNPKVQDEYKKKYGNGGWMAYQKDRQKQIESKAREMYNNDYEQATAQRAREAYNKDYEQTIAQRARESYNRDYESSIETAAEAEYLNAHQQEITDSATESFGTDYQEAITKADKAKNKAIYDYIDYGDTEGKKDAGIANLDAQYQARLEQAKQSKTITEQEYQSIMSALNNRNAEEFNDYTKKDENGFLQQSNALTKHLTEVEGDLQRLQDETAGSGIAGNKSK